MSNQANSDLELLDDFRVLTKTLSSFESYGRKTKNGIIQTRRNNLEKLLKDSFANRYIGELGLLEHLDNLEHRAQDNQAFLDYIYQVGKSNWAEPREESDRGVEWASGDANDYSKVQSTLKQLVREWSSAGAEERNDSYGLVIRELESIYPSLVERHDIKVLIPGCGLARLPFDLASKGFQAQGNEFSYHMLFTSNFILNHTGGYPDMFKIYPYISSFSHKRSYEDQLQEISIPDVDPNLLVELAEGDSTVPEDGLMSMTAGSFDEIYPGNLAEENMLFDVITTVFFIDTSPLLPRTLKTIADTLKLGGYWINFGPLLWHYEDDDESNGFELPMNIITEHLIPSFGFKIIKHTTNNPCRYSSNPFSKSSFIYNCDFWVAEKIE